MVCSEHNLSLGVLLLSEDEGLASLDNSETLGLGLGALELEHDLLGVLGLLSEHGLGLSSESLLLHIVSSLSLGGLGGLPSLVLGDLVESVLLGFLAETLKLLGDMHHLFFVNLTYNK